jgi:hypothetical protein
MLRVKIQSMRHRRLTSLHFPKPGRSGWLGSAGRFQRRPVCPGQPAKRHGAVSRKWVVREVACLPKINVSWKLPKLPPIPTLRLWNSQQGFQARHRSFGIIDPIQIVLNRVGSLWATGLNVA